MSAPETTEAIRSRIASRLKGLMELRGVDRSHMAEAIGTSETRVARVLKGSSELSAVELALAAKAVGTTASVILGEAQPSADFLRG